MIRVGFVGLGHNGVAHMEAHLRVGKSEIAGVCDWNPEVLARVCETFVAAVAEGKHVLVEKPLVNSIEQIERMIEAARSARRGCRWRWGTFCASTPCSRLPGADGCLQHRCQRRESVQGNRNDVAIAAEGARYTRRPTGGPY